MPLEYLLPLLCGLMTSLGAMFYKKSIQEGAGLTRVLFVMHLCLFLLTIPYFLTGAQVLDWSRWWGPVLTSFVTFLAGVCLIQSLKTADISIQTPLMGTKAVFVATYSLFLATQPIPLSWFIGAFMTFFSIMIMGLSDFFRKKVSVSGVLYALGSSSLFALTDVMVAKEAPLFGRQAFLMLMNSLLAIESLALIPFFKKSLWSIPKKTWLFCLGGGGLSATQHLILLLTLSYFGKATAVNILYSSRGLWGIVLVWFIGHWFGSKEKANLGKRVLVRRFIGALLLTGAIVMVLLDG